MPSLSSGTALVVVDSSLAQHVFFRETMLPVLEFWGLPMTLVDLAADAAAIPDPAGVALVLLPQEGIGAGRLARLDGLIAAATAAGAGVVCCDPAIAVTGGGEDAPVGLAVRPWSAPAPAREAALADTPHFITRMQRAYRRFRFRKPVPWLPPADADGDIPLLTGDGGAPVLTARDGRARVVQWHLSSWVWSQDFMGFARGMDALLWRSLLWAARKPFAMTAFPPLGRFRFDDCRGLWRTPADFAFLDVMREVGEVPNLGICMSAVTPDAWRLLAERAAAGTVEVVPHVLEPDTGLFNVADAAASDGNDDPLARSVRDAFAAHGCPMARGVSDHNHELSRRGLRIARELGMAGRMNVMRIGERWETVHTRWRPAPFGVMHFALDRFVDAPEIFTAINHHASFSDSFLGLADDRFLCTDFGGFTEDRWDFLNGHVDAAGRKDIDAALERLLRHTELALTSLFFVGSITHTHFATHLSQADWRRLLQGYRGYADGFGYRPAPYDRIVAYAADRAGGGGQGRPLALVAEDRGGETVERWA